MGDGPIADTYMIRFGAVAKSTKAGKQWPRLPCFGCDRESVTLLMGFDVAISEAIVAPVADELLVVAGVVLVVGCVVEATV